MARILAAALGLTCRSADIACSPSMSAKESFSVSAPAASMLSDTQPNGFRKKKAPDEPRNMIA